MSAPVGVSETATSAARLRGLSRLGCSSSASTQTLPASYETFWRSGVPLEEWIGLPCGCRMDEDGRSAVAHSAAAPSHGQELPGPGLFQFIAAVSIGRHSARVRAVLGIPAARHLPVALPNPSFKPSPNGVPPGRRYSAGLHYLQRRPSVTPLVPA